MRIRYRLSTALAGLTMISVALAWFAARYQRQRAIEEVLRLGAIVEFESGWSARRDRDINWRDGSGAQRLRDQSPLAMLVDEATKITFFTRFPHRPDDDENLVRILDTAKRIPTLRQIWIGSPFSPSKRTRSLLNRLGESNNTTWLSAEIGYDLESVQQAIPHCKIIIDGVEYK